MTICSACHHKNKVGAVFCEECGTVLVSDGTTISTRQIKNTGKNGFKIKVPAKNIKGWATLHILASGQLLPLNGRSEFTLGRFSDGQPILPDIDLGPYQAYSLGVSRIHAMIKRNANGMVSIMDLGSSNGTYLNGRRLPPNEPSAVSHGDIVALGKLKVQILLA